MLEIRGEFSRVRLGPAFMVLASIGQVMFAFRINPTPVYRTVFPIKTSTPLSKQTNYHSLMEKVRVLIDFDLKKVIVHQSLRFISLDTLDAVSNYLYDVRGVFSFRIHYFVGKWISEFFVDAPLAIERMQQLMGFCCVPLIDSYFIRSVSFEKCSQRLDFSNLECAFLGEPRVTSPILSFSN